MRFFVATLSVSLVLAACTPTTTGTTLRQEVNQTTTSTSAVPGDVCARGDHAYVGDGIVAALGVEAGDAAQVETVRWTSEGTCERVSIEFTTQDGAPASTLGLTGVSVISSSGIIRVVLPDEVSGTAIADSLIGGKLVERAYVVRLADGRLAVDIHGADGIPLTARTALTVSPASLVVDVATDGSLTPPIGVTASGTTVMLSPVPSPSLYPITVKGYARPALRSVAIQLSGRDDEPLNRSIALDGAIDAWQAFDDVIPDGPSGNATLFVGTIDANGMPDDGATVSLDLP